MKTERSALPCAHFADQSASEGLRLVDQGGVRIDGTVIRDKALKVAAGTCIVQVGKRRFARVTVSA